MVEAVCPCVQTTVAVAAARCSCTGARGGLAENTVSFITIPSVADDINLCAITNDKSEAFVHLCQPLHLLRIT